MADEWQNKERLRRAENDATYFRRSASVLAQIGMETIGEKELARRLDEKFASDIMHTVER